MEILSSETIEGLITVFDLWAEWRADATVFSLSSGERVTPGELTARLTYLAENPDGDPTDSDQELLYLVRNLLDAVKGNSASDPEAVDALRQDLEGLMGLGFPTRTGQTTAVEGS